MFNFEAVYLKLHKHLHYIYLLYAIPLVYLTAIITPPFQSPDEPNHFLRAEQVSRLDLVPVFVHDKTNVNSSIKPVVADTRIIYPDKGGFMTDKGILEIENKFSVLFFNPNIKVNPLMITSTQNIKWGNGNGYKNFGNTAIYPPVVYLMPAVGIATGKLLHLSIVNTLYLSRILNSIISITICFFALMLAKRSNILMFIVLLFPMTIALFASVSQDAILISCAFLFVSIIDNTAFGDNKAYPKWQVFTMIIVMSIIGISKPPYVLLAFVFLFLKLSPRAKAAGIIIPMFSVLMWLMINHANFAIRFAPPELRINAKLQVLYIIHYPFKFIGLFFKYDPTALINCSHTFVGVLGWLDLPFSNDYYHWAYAILLVGFAIGLRSTWKNNMRLKTGLIICAFLTIISILTAQYVTWTALEASSLNGMQGRYLLPVFPFLALALSCTIKNEKITRFRSILTTSVFLFPIYTGVAIVLGLIHRYYIA